METYMSMHPDLRLKRIQRKLGELREQLTAPVTASQMASADAPVMLEQICALVGDMCKILQDQLQWPAHRAPNPVKRS